MHDGRRLVVLVSQLTWPEWARNVVGLHAENNENKGSSGQGLEHMLLYSSLSLTDKDRDACQDKQKRHHIDSTHEARERAHGVVCAAAATAAATAWPVSNACW